MCFPANIGILLRIPILKNTCERLYLKIITLVTNLSKVGYFWIFYPFKCFSILNFAMTKWFSPVTSFVKVFLLRSSHQRCSLRKGVLRNFTKFTGKHLCQSLFFNKVAGRLGDCFYLLFILCLKQFFIFIIKKLFYVVYTSSQMLLFFHRWDYC